MTSVLGGSAAGMLLLGALYAENATDQLTQGLNQIQAIRKGLMVDPGPTLSELCHDQAESPPNRAFCRISVLWQQDSGNLTSVCGDAPLEPGDGRLRPRRYYEVHLDCPAPIPRFGRLSLKVRLAR